MPTFQKDIFAGAALCHRANKLIIIIIIINFMESTTYYSNKEDIVVYTRDGTVDLHGRPVLASRTGKWKACAFLLGYEAFERMAFYGIASNLVVYLTTQLHEDTVTSVTNVNNWSGAVWMTPILGAYIADSYFGRFWTFTVSALIYTTGMVLLTLAVSIKALKPRSCVTSASAGGCDKISKASPAQMAFFYVALYTIALGAGGTKPNISTFGADQFDDYDPKEKQLKVSFFNWWMFSSFIGALFATLGLVYIQENVGWGLGYGIPTIGLILSLVLFYLGTPRYRHKPRGTASTTSSNKSPARDIVDVVISTLANWRVRAPTDPSQLYELDPQFYAAAGKRQSQHTPVFRFFDKAAAIKQEGEVEGEGEGIKRTGYCTVTQVEKTKRIYGMFLIWLTLLVPSTINAQINTLFIKQGTTLDRHVRASFRIPAASLGSFVTLSMLLTVPFYDRYFVPLMRRKTGNPRGISLLQRLGIGCVIQNTALAVAYLVELRRMQVIKEKDTISSSSSSSSSVVVGLVVLPMSIFWLLPQYILLGIADVFSIGVLEFFYDQSPDDMQSLGTTFFTSAIGVGNFLNSFLVMAVDKVTARASSSGKSWIGKNLNDSHLDYYYGFLFLMATLNLALFLWVSNAYVYKTDNTTTTTTATTTTTTSSTTSTAHQQEEVLAINDHKPEYHQYLEVLNAVH